MRVQRISPQVENTSQAKEYNLDLLNPIIAKYNAKKGSLIPLLQATQELYGYIPPEAFDKLSDATNYAVAKIYGVATFYAQFRLKPTGKNIVKICHGTACHVQDAKTITIALEDSLKIKNGQTTPDGLFTIESVACLGCCSLAPVMMIGDDTYGNLTKKDTVKTIRHLKRKEKAKAKKAQKK